MGPLSLPGVVLPPYPGDYGGCVWGLLLAGRESRVWQGMPGTDGGMRFGLPELGSFMYC